MSVCMHTRLFTDTHKEYLIKGTSLWSGSKQTFVKSHMSLVVMNSTKAIFTFSTVFRYTNALQALSGITCYSYFVFHKGQLEGCWYESVCNIHS